MYIQKAIHIVLLGCLALIATAQEIVQEGITYHLENDEALLYSSEECPSDVLVPETILYEGANYPVTTIMRGAFFRNPQLKHIVVPATVTTIGERAFYMCDSLQSVHIQGEIDILRQETFYGCSILEDVQISRLRELRDYVFASCSSLQKIELPSNLEIIGEGCFGECTRLKTVVLPEHLDKISNWAFAFTAIESIVIPQSVDKIGYGIFAGCSRLQHIEVAAGNRVYDSREGCNAIIETALNTLIASCESSTIAASVTHIATDAFAYSKRKEIDIPANVKVIEDSAFHGCQDLISARVNKHSKIHKQAFPKITKIIKK